MSFKEVAGGQNVTINPSDSVDSISETYEGMPIHSNVYEKSLANGDFYVIGSVASYDSDAQDYLSYGLWVYAPTSSRGTSEIGLYVDGGDPFTRANISGLTGSATYSSEEGAFAVYDSGSRVDVLSGDVTLTANFDTDRISGEITNIYSDSLDLQLKLGVEVELQETSIDNSKEGGFWTGDTLTTNTVDNARYVGKWGGQFYGNGSTNGKPRIGTGFV